MRRGAIEVARVSAAEWGGFGDGPGQLNVPLGIAVDADGNVYVSDSHNHRIQKFARRAPQTSRKGAKTQSIAQNRVGRPLAP